MELVNKDGKTLTEFLETYDPAAYPRPAVTVDMVLFSIDGDKPVIMLIKRGNHPFIGQWAFPGGFVGEGESTEEAAARELREETAIEGVNLEQLYTVSTPGRDPRGWTVSVLYSAVLKSDAIARAGDDAEDARWFTIDYIRSGDEYHLKLSGGGEVLEAKLKVARTKMGAIDINRTEILQNSGIAFDHAKLILLAIEKL